MNNILAERVNKSVMSAHFQLFVDGPGNRRDSAPARAPYSFPKLSINFCASVDK